MDISTDWTSALEYPFEAGRVFVPAEVELKSDQLRWTMNGVLLNTKARMRVPRGSILEKFRKLHQKSDEAIRQFTLEFGVAWFCGHGFPGSHYQTPLREFFKIKRCLPITADGTAQSLSAKQIFFSAVWFQESLSLYRHYSSAADAIITASSLVNSGQVPKSDLFLRFAYAKKPHELTLHSLGVLPSKTRSMIAIARQQIESEVNTWIALSQAHPALAWSYSRNAWRKELTHSPFGVLGPIGLALLTTVPQQGGWLICSLCEESYPASRPAVPGRNHYCPECRGKPEMWTLLKRQQRAKR